MALLDLKDLQAFLVWIGENRAEISLRYGNIAVASVGAIQRRLMVLENQGGTHFFGEPALELADLMRCDEDGRGIVNIMSADRLMNSPRLYATFLLWLLSELFETLPEIGNPAKPKLVFFFDEAHLLFNDAPKALVDKVEQVARLIRSKGVGVYFITQNPADVPDAILGQLGNRVQHALRAFTGRDQQELRRAAMTYRTNPAFDTETAIREVGTGEAVTSLLEDKGIPGIVERTLIRPPSSKLGPITEEQREMMIRTSALFGKYETPLDRDSAYEALKRIAAEAAREAEEAAAAEAQVKEAEREFKAARRYEPNTPAKRVSTSRTRQPETLGEALGAAVMKELKGTTGRRIVRGLMGGLFRGR